MIPIGDFLLLKETIMDKYADYEQITFGILLADPRQTESREYILNYLAVFHKESGKLFNFFLPGYDQYYQGPANDSKCEIRIDNNRYCFSEEMFNEFCKNMKSFWGIQYTYNPMLILMSIERGYLRTAKYIVIELDDNESHSARRSGLFFQKLFDIVRDNPDLKHIKVFMGMTEHKGNMLETLIKEIAPSWLLPTASIGRELRRFRIRHT